MTPSRSQLAQARVLVVGDVMLDRFVYGSVERISPEAPIPVVRIKNEIAMLGGAIVVLVGLVMRKSLPETLTMRSETALPRLRFSNQRRW